MQLAPIRSRQSYRHEAFLWQTEADFLAALVAFVEEGLAAGEPVMVAVTPQHTTWLQKGLGIGAGLVEFVDTDRLARNPARIIPAWREFVRARGGPLQPVRGIGEPIWPGQHPEELVECHLHEALLNLAIDPDTPLWLICPYEAGALGEEVLEEAHRSHPVIVEAGTHRGSPHYAGRTHADTLFTADLSRPPRPPREAVFTDGTAHRLSAYVRLELYVAGLPDEQADRLAAATKLLALDSLRRGSPRAVVRIWSEPHAIICEVADDAAVTDPLLGRSLPTDEHEALWQANQACDLVQLRSSSTGTIVRILSWQ